MAVMANPCGEAAHCRSQKDSLKQEGDRKFLHHSRAAEESEHPGNRYYKDSEGHGR
jgi:hypothetical protein